MYEDWLYHYGTKGMKWGVRKSPLYKFKKSIKRGVKEFKKHSDERKKNRIEKAKVEEQKKKEPETAIKRKKLSEMSNQELTSVLSRLDMEKRYIDHMERLNPKKESRIKKWATDALSYGVDKVTKKILDNISDSLFKETKKDSPIDIKKLNLDKLGPNEAGSTAKYIKNLNTIKSYMNGDTSKLDDEKD